VTHLHVDGVALRTYDDSYPFGYTPYGHQQYLQTLFEDESSFVAVNDSPTGGGKTSSWLAPVLEQGLDTVAVYPTNALIEDQYVGIADAVEGSAYDATVMTVTSETLSAKRTEYSVTSNAAVIDRWIREHRGEQVLLLTNPDIFVMMCRSLYATTTRAYKQFEVAVVDEFHRAGLKQRNTLRYLLDELLERTNTRLARVVFLSATPDDKQESAFERAMTAPYFRVTDTEATERRSFDRPLSSDWRAVMPPVGLDVRHAPTFGTADVLIDEDASSTLEFCRKGRTVLMLDGIHEVELVYDWLDAKLDRRVERIDGFHSENKREKLESFDVLVSNSAVEVGIDFDVDRVIFAGHDEASFLQRLGRLRRKDQQHAARCYVPRRVKRAFDELDGTQVSRQDLRQHLGDIYPDPREPDTFDWRYSAPEALEHLDHRLRNTPSDLGDVVKQRGIERIRRHFLAEHGLSFADLERTTDTVDWRTLRELQWYRGDSLQALVWDSVDDTLRSYDLFYLLRYGDVEFHDRSAFERIVPDEYVSTVDRQARYVDGFCTYYGPIETTEEGYGRDVAFTGASLAGWIAETDDRGRKPRVQSGLKVTVDAGELTPIRHGSVNTLNQRLKGQSEDSARDDGGLLCFPVAGRSNVIKNTYELGPFFFLYPIAVSNSEPYSLALGTDALYLHCHIQEQRERDDSLLEGL
jgi:CRISPR-associated endonuclease/helicase Cas3